jgi:hypothetical protein
MEREGEAGKRREKELMVDCEMVSVHRAVALAK